VTGGIALTQPAKRVEPIKRLEPVKRVGLPLLLLAVFFTLFFTSAAAYGGDSPALLKEVRTFVKENYIYPVDDRVLSQDTAKGIVAALGDPHSEFLWADELKNLVDSTNGDYTGVGMELVLQYHQGSFYPTVFQTFSGSPAQKAGILPGDRIIAVNGESIVGKSLEYAVSLIKGDPGTKVVLTISRDGADRPFSITLTREKIHLSVVTYRVLGDKIGYVRISIFSMTAGEEVDSAIQALLKQGCEGIILDLRGNPGGYVDAGLKTAELFIPGGKPLMYIRTRQGSSAFISEGDPYQIPLAVLIDGESASASEIVAGAIKDYGVGTLIGTTTYGKGTVQTVQSLETAEAAVKLTVAEYFSPKKNKIDGKGVSPDIRVEGNQQQLEAAKKLLTEKLSDPKAGAKILILDPFKGTAYLNGLKVAGIGRPVMEKNIVMVPLRMVSSFLDSYVSWDASTKTAKLNYGNSHAVISMEEPFVSVNSRPTQLSAAPKLIDGRIYVPLRFLSEFDGISIVWDPDLECVEVTRAK